MADIIYADGLTKVYRGKVKALHSWECLATSRRGGRSGQSESFSALTTRHGYEEGRLQ